MSKLNNNRNFRREKTFSRNVGSINEPDFRNHTVNVLNAQGAGAGFPNQFKAMGNPQTKENIAIDTVNDSYIHSIPRDRLVRYDPMVLDVPFDPIGTQKSVENLRILGFTSLVLGGMYLMEGSRG